ncbi:MAG TPA: alpha-hydroxy acid oxidase [Ktedonobacterales bacterium]|jgi:4-hydroxymandelate oxidase
MRPINIAEYEAIARARLHPAVWDYYSAGADDEVTLRENRAAFERIRLRPRALAPVGSVNLSASLLGIEVALPIGIAPAAIHGAACEDGERATAQAAGALQALMIASTESTCSLEEIAQAASGPLWFQLYFTHRSHALAERLAQRAEAAGYRALVVTVDSPRWGRKERHIRSESTYDWPPSGNFPDDAGDANEAEPGEVEQPDEQDAQDDAAAITWADIAWLQSITSLPIVLKGILTAEDAALAVARGVAGIVVSNHGGRQLDGVLPTIEALPEVVTAAAGRCEVYLDGGVRRGTDALKALALGARAVFVGRPILWGLAADGADGAQHALELLRDELALAMALAGRPTLASIDASLIEQR